MDAFLVVRSVDDLERACGEVTGFLRLWRARAADAQRRLLPGVWVDATRVDHPPSCLFLACHGGMTVAVPVRSTVGVAGVWTLCLLEDGEVDACGLVRALLDLSRREGCPGSEPRFIPVLASDGSDRAGRQGLAGLPADARRRLLPPLYQDPASGVLYPPSYSDRWRA